MNAYGQTRQSRRGLLSVGKLGMHLGCGGPPSEDATAAAPNSAQKIRRMGFRGGRSANDSASSHQTLQATPVTELHVCNVECISENSAPPSYTA